MFTTPSGSYNNTFDDVVLTSPANEIAWMAANKVNINGWDHVSLYGMGSKLNTAFANAAKTLYLKKIKLGIACSRVTEVDAVIAFNAAQTDFRKRIHFITTELEAEYANNNCTKAQYKQWIPEWYAKCKAAGIKMYIYEGWNYMYDVTVGNCDGFWLHVYRTSTQIAKTDDAYNYLATAGNDRLISIAAEAVKKEVIVEVSILTSCEPPPANDGKGFSFDWYKYNRWGSVLPMVKDSFNRLATQAMKDSLILDGEIIFVSKHMHTVTG